MGSLSISLQYTCDVPAQYTAPCPQWHRITRGYITCNRADAANKSENSFDDIVPDSDWIVNVRLGQIQVNIGRVVLPFLGLVWFLDTESGPPGYTNDGVGKEVGRG